MARISAVVGCCLAAVVQAGFEDIEAQLVVKLQEKLNATRDADGLRGAGFSDYFKFQIRDIVNSGCWCYFDFDHHKARGRPVNDVDRYCKILHQGYQCAIMDLGADCVPWAVDYTASSGLGTHEKYFEACQFNNGGRTCAAVACSVENYFVSQVYKHINAGLDFDATVKHDAVPPFSVADNCPKEGTAIESERACCSEYPERFPYRTLDGARGCCGAKTYDKTVFGCCPDQTLNNLCI